MIKFTVLYNWPDDADAATFKAHYLETHARLVRALPGLDRFEVGFTSPGADGARAPYFLIAELYFTDPAAMGAAMATPEGKELAADTPNVAPYMAMGFMSDLV